jgi:DNA-binding NarL/FixJ family response regulator
MKTKTKCFRILIVDDHPMIRAGIAGMLSRENDMEVCGDASDADEAIAQVTRLKPDLVILDISLKSGNGLDVIKRLGASSRSKSASGVRILVHSMYEDSLYAERVLQAGAMGFINKQEPPEVLLTAIRQVLAGKVYLSPQLTDRLLHRAVGHRMQHSVDPVTLLTDREMQVFQLIGKATQTRRIAEQLFVSVHTIETHRENIKKKLGIKSGPELNQRAVQWCLENG